MAATVLHGVPAPLLRNARSKNARSECAPQITMLCQFLTARSGAALEVLPYALATNLYAPADSFFAKWVQEKTSTLAQDSRKKRRRRGHNRQRQIGEGGLLATRDESSRKKPFRSPRRGCISCISDHSRWQQTKLSASERQIRY